MTLKSTGPRLESLSCVVDVGPVRDINIGDRETDHNKKAVQFY